MTMTRFAVFFRAVNVCGHGALKMNDLVSGLVQDGFQHVSSYRKSGNLILSSSRTDEGAIIRTIEDRLEQMTGTKVDIFRVRMERMEDLVGAAPFEGRLSEGDRGFATFMSMPPTKVPILPVTFQNGITMIGLIDNVALTMVQKNVGSGPLNDLVERRFSVRATTRNWSTIKALVEKA